MINRPLRESYTHCLDLISGLDPQFYYARGAPASVPFLIYFALNTIVSFEVVLATAGP